MLDRDLDVAEVVLLEEGRLPQRRLHERLGGGLAVLLEESLVEGPGVDADADRGAVVLGSPGDLADLVVERLDVPRVDAHGRTPGFDGREDVLRLEVDVGDDRDVALAGDLGQGVGVVLAGHRDAYDLAAGGSELGDLLQRAVDVGRERRAHRLDADGRVAADQHRMVRVLEEELAGGATRCDHGRRCRWHAEVDAHLDIMAASAAPCRPCGSVHFPPRNWAEPQGRRATAGPSGGAGLVSRGRWASPGRPR